MTGDSTDAYPNNRLGVVQDGVRCRRQSFRDRHRLRQLELRIWRRRHDPDLADITFFVKVSGGTWNEIPKAEARFDGTTTDDHTFLYHDPYDQLGENDAMTWPGSMTALFGPADSWFGLDAISTTNACGLSALKLWNKKVTLADLDATGAGAWVERLSWSGDDSDMGFGLGLALSGDGARLAAVGYNGMPSRVHELVGRIPPPSLPPPAPLAPLAPPVVYGAITAITQLGADIDGEAAVDFSGYSVALSSDGAVLAVGAPLNEDAGWYSGHVRVYQWDAAANSGTGSWTQLGGDIDGEASGDRSGERIALSSDGTILAIGAFQNDGTGDQAGHVRVYKWSGSSWAQHGSDIDGEVAGDQSSFRWR